jgi:hypothetical protein
MQGNGILLPISVLYSAQVCTRVTSSKSGRARCGRRAHMRQLVCAQPHNGLDGHAACSRRLRGCSPQQVNVESKADLIQHKPAGWREEAGEGVAESAGRGASV